MQRPTAIVSAPMKHAARASTPDGFRSIINSSLADEWLATSLALHCVPRAATDCGTPRRHRRQALFCLSPFFVGLRERELIAIAAAPQALACLSCRRAGATSAASSALFRTQSEKVNPPQRFTRMTVLAA